ncbi:MAG: hypothetical protein NT145_07065, partial [Elusimicrobia bacterium]|nr:hypothetical protein [Elusimicrobiota bacterium]
MNFKKGVALVTLVLFTFSSVFSGTARAVFDVKIGAKQILENIQDLVIPQSAGRITDGQLFDSKQLVINIQDLHCNPEVQRNISKILSELDKKFGFKKVYVEGGYGNISTSWICDIKDKQVKTEILEDLMNQGRLTGSEYYSALSNKPDLLKGIEDEKIHKANIVRLARILDKKAYFEKKLKILDKDLELMKEEYFSSRNKHFDSLIDQHKSASIKTEKYYELLSKYIQKINENPNNFNNLSPIRLENYPHISTYIELSRATNNFNYDRISRQLQEFVREIKSKMPYGDYQLLLEKTDNFSKSDKLYDCIIQIAKSYNLNLEHKFPDLKKFLTYVEKTKKLNPVKLICEEKRLTEEIRIGFSKDISELEVSFLSDFYGYFKDYLFNTLSADDYKYFIQRFDKFKSVWNKYAYNSTMNALIEEFGLLNSFYKTNCQRNECFLSKLPITSQSDDQKRAAKITELEQEKITASIKKSEIVVVITGGFHTDGLREALLGRGISYIAITPNITKDSPTSSVVYAALAKEQAKVFSAQALALALGSTNAKVLTVGNDEIVLELNGETITLSRNGNKTFQLSQPVEGIRIAGRQLDKEAIETTVAQAFEISQSIQEFVNPLAGSDLIFKLVKYFSAWAGREGIFGYNGLIWSIASNKEVQDAIAKEGVDESELAMLPDFLQEIIKSHTLGKKMSTSTNPVINAIFQNPLIGSILDEQMFQAPLRELKDIKEALVSGEKRDLFRGRHSMNDEDFQRGMGFINSVLLIAEAGRLTHSGWTPEQKDEVNADFGAIEEIRFIWSITKKVIKEELTRDDAVNELAKKYADVEEIRNRLGLILDKGLSSFYEALDGGFSIEIAGKKAQKAQRKEFQKYNENVLLKDLYQGLMIEPVIMDIINLVIRVVEDQFKTFDIEALRGVIKKVLENALLDMELSLENLANVAAHAAWNFLHPLTPLTSSKTVQQAKLDSILLEKEKAQSFDKNEDVAKNLKEQLANLKTINEELYTNVLQFFASFCGFSTDGQNLPGWVHEWRCDFLRLSGKKLDEEVETRILNLLDSRENREFKKTWYEVKKLLYDKFRDMEETEWEKRLKNFEVENFVNYRIAAKLLVTMLWKAYPEIAKKVLPEEREERFEKETASIDYSETGPFEFTVYGKSYWVYSAEDLITSGLDVENFNTKLLGECEYFVVDIENFTKDEGYIALRQNESIIWDKDDGIADSSIENPVIRIDFGGRLILDIVRKGNEISFRGKYLDSNKKITFRTWHPSDNSLDDEIFFATVCHYADDYFKNKYSQNATLASQPGNNPAASSGSQSSPGSTNMPQFVWLDAKDAFNHLDDLHKRIQAINPDDTSRIAHLLGDWQRERNNFVAQAKADNWKEFDRAIIQKLVAMYGDTLKFFNEDPGTVLTHDMSNFLAQLIENRQDLVEEQDFFYFLETFKTATNEICCLLGRQAVQDFFSRMQQFSLEMKSFQGILDALNGKAKVETNAQSLEKLILFCDQYELTDKYKNRQKYTEQINTWLEPIWDKIIKANGWEAGIESGLLAKDYWEQTKTGWWDVVKQIAKQGSNVQAVAPTTSPRPAAKPVAKPAPQNTKDINVKLDEIERLMHQWCETGEDPGANSIDCPELIEQWVNIGTAAEWNTFTGFNEDSVDKLINILIYWVKNIYLINKKHGSNYFENDVLLASMIVNAIVDLSQHNEDVVKAYDLINLIKKFAEVFPSGQKDRDFEEYVWEEFDSIVEELSSDITWDEDAIGKLIDAVQGSFGKANPSPILNSQGGPAFSSWETVWKNTFKDNGWNVPLAEKIATKQNGRWVPKQGWEVVAELLNTANSGWWPLTTKSTIQNYLKNHRITRFVYDHINKSLAIAWISVSPRVLGAPKAELEAISSAIALKIQGNEDEYDRFINAHKPKGISDEEWLVSKAREMLTGGLRNIENIVKKLFDSGVNEKTVSKAIVKAHFKYNLVRIIKTTFTNIGRILIGRKPIPYALMTRKNANKTSIANQINSKIEEITKFLYENDGISYNQIYPKWEETEHALKNISAKWDEYDNNSLSKLLNLFVYSIFHRILLTPHISALLTELLKNRPELAGEEDLFKLLELVEHYNKDFFDRFNNDPGFGATRTTTFFYDAIKPFQNVSAELSKAVDRSSSGWTTERIQKLIDFSRNFTYEQRSFGKLETRSQTSHMNDWLFAVWGKVIAETIGDKDIWNDRLMKEIKETKGFEKIAELLEKTQAKLQYNKTEQETKFEDITEVEINYLESGPFEITLGGKNYWVYSAEDFIHSGLDIENFNADALAKFEYFIIDIDNFDKDGGYITLADGEELIIKDGKIKYNFED